MANIMTASELLKGAQRELQFPVFNFPHILGAIQGWEPWTVGASILMVQGKETLCLVAERIHVKHLLRETRVIPLRSLEDLTERELAYISEGTMSSEMLEFIRLRQRRLGGAK